MKYNAKSDQITWLGWFELSPRWFFEYGNFQYGNEYIHALKYIHILKLTYVCIQI